MRNVQTIKDNVTQLEAKTGELTSTDQETADLLADYFKEVFTVEDTTSLPIVEENDLNWKDDNIIFSEEIVLKKLQRLQVDKSQGPDGIHPQLLNRCGVALAISHYPCFSKNHTTQVFYHKTGKKPILLQSLKKGKGQKRLIIDLFH